MKTLKNSYKNEFSIFNGNITYWDKNSFPLLLTYSKNESTDLKQSILYASEIWNKKLGKKVFILMELNPESKVLLGKIPEHRVIKINVGRLSSQNDLENLGETYSYHFGFSGRRYSCVVTLNKIMPTINYNGVMVHELGHVLGLSHDKEISSIMYQTYYYDKPWYIEEVDVQLLKFMISSLNG